MKKLLISLLICVFGAFLANAEKKDALPEYQIEGVSAGNGSNSIVKVTIITKKKDIATNAMLAKCAVHGVLFRGYATPPASGMGGESNHPAMAGSPLEEQSNAEFYQTFFDNGAYNAYAQPIDETRRVVKSGKMYKVSCEVTLREGQLRKDLTDKGIIKSLKSGW